MCKYRRTPYRRSLSVCISLFLALAMPLALGSTLDIAITDNRAPGAILYVAIYTADDGEGNWRQEPYRGLEMTLPDEDTARLRLELPPGDYAARAYADINGNGELDTGHRNRPKEPFAISAAADRRRPSVHFRHAIFRLDQEPGTVELKLIYPEELPTDADDESDDGE